MKRFLPIVALLLAGSGCVSFGITCRSEKVEGWVKVRRFAFSPNKATTTNLAEFRERVCR